MMTLRPKVLFAFLLLGCFVQTSSEAIAQWMRPDLALSQDEQQVQGTYAGFQACDKCTLGVRLVLTPQPNQDESGTYILTKIYVYPPKSGQSGRGSWKRVVERGEWKVVPLAIDSPSNQVCLYPPGTLGNSMDLLARKCFAINQSELIEAPLTFDQYGGFSMQTLAKVWRLPDGHEYPVLPRRP